MELEVFTTNVELKDIPSYSTNIAVEGQLLKLSFMWNERIGKRTLYITDSADQCYLQNTILHPNEPFELNANAVLNDLPYSVTLIKTGDQKRVGNIFNWSKDFILCFSRTVDLDVKKLNVVYGVTTPSTPILPPPPPPPPPYGDWILNQGFTIVGDDIRYTGFKTNGIDTYDSFALSNLQDALVKSFHDPDMQQWQGFKDAIGSNSFTWDGGSHISFNKVRYKGYGYIPPAVTINWWNPAIFYVDTLDYGLFQNTAIQQFGQTSWDHMRIDYAGPPNPNLQNQVYVLTNGYNEISLKVVEETIQVTMTFVEIAQKIISNLQSPNEGTSLLAQAYVDAVANSIFNTDTAKQFVKLDDLIPQLETNKVLRN